MLGRAGEAVARRALERLGYEILETNFRTRDGEIDLVAREAGQYVFVEVKTRRDRSYGPPEESITEIKQTRLVSVAQAFLRSAAIASKWSSGKSTCPNQIRKLKLRSSRDV